MIYIEKGTASKLPEKYHSINNICAIIYDQITEIFAAKNYEELKYTNFNYDRENHILVDEFEKKEIHILDWLKENNKNDEISDFLSKHLTLSISSDFSNFIYEALSCAQRGKMTVAYALLRKPFTDELLLLEQILNDPKEFIDRFFHSGDPKDYDPSSRKTDKLQIIQTAVDKLKPKYIFSADLIYKLRFEKDSLSGLNGLSNQALHIVTNDKNYKTLDQNLNFVFSNKDDINKYWDYFYHFIPYLIIYSASVIDSIIFSFLQDQENQNLKYLKSFQRFIAIIKWTECITDPKDKKEEEFYYGFQDDIQLKCDKCNEEIKLEKADFELFLESRMILCPKCFNNVLSSQNSLNQIKRFLDKVS
ncbi:MAG: hypothetical protein ABJ092_14695 [Gillisia sp.]